MNTHPGISKFSLLCSLAVLSLAPAALAQSETARALSRMPLERYDNPPALLRPTQTSPRMVSQHDVFTSYQVNVNANGQNIVGDAANETSITVDPTNGNRIAIGWRQFNSVSSNFRQGGWGYSTNGGTSWTFPGVLENNIFRSDPVLGSDETGKFFYLSLLQSFCDDMWRSLNSGQSWIRLSPEGGAGGGDKQWFTIDKTNSTGHGFQYQAWSTAAPCSFGQFSRSTDGGTTWMNPINIPSQPVWGTLDVDTNGNLFIGGSDFGSSFFCVRSSNAKNGGVTPTFDQNVTVNMGGSILFGSTINPEGLAGQVFLAVDRSGTATNNNIYMVASLQPTGFSNGSDVMFVRSTNGGTSFSAPVRINDDPVNHNKWHWFGTISIAPNGRIDSVWLDSRNAANNTDSQLFYSYSTDGGATWAPNVAVSNSFNPFLGYPNQNKMGDYITVVSDNTGGDVAYAATFNGEEDVYFVRVAPAVPMAQSAVSRKTHGAAGTFDIDLPLTGTPGIECRSGGGTNDYTMVVTFTGNVTVTGTPQAEVILGTGCVGSGGVCNGGTVAVSGAVVTIPLTNVGNAQTINIRLNGVNSASVTADVVIPMTRLLGDTNGTGTVSSADVAQTKSRIGQTLDGTNFRSDVNVSGGVNSSDVTLIKQNIP